MPQIPPALIAILAISRLGAIHAVVFGGFAPSALAQRIEASKPRVVMTASCGVEGAKGAVSYRPFVRGAVEKSGWRGEVLVWQREEGRWEGLEGGRGERDWRALVEGGRRRGVKAEAVAVGSGEGVYVIYTSGECPESYFTRSEVLVRCALRGSCVSLVPMGLLFLLFWLPLSAWSLAFFDGLPLCLSVFGGHSVQHYPVNAVFSEF